MVDAASGQGCPGERDPLIAGARASYGDFGTAIEASGAPLAWTRKDA